jgi:hypothetical protein
MLLGNKSDLECKISKEELALYAEKCLIEIVSCHTRFNIQAVWNKIVSMLAERWKTQNKKGINPSA